ncbi:hypothetical protein ACFX1S_044715 [Malus domestica]
MANEAHFLSTSLSFLSFNKAVLPSKGLSFLENSRFNRSRQTRTSMEMQGMELFGLIFEHWAANVWKSINTNSGEGCPMPKHQA